MGKRINSLNKGKTFERKVADMLTKLTGVNWTRVPMSGAYATNNNSDDPRFCGDVFTECEDYNDYVIECKATNNLEINDLFNPKIHILNIN